jgi:hypothetical protein
MGSPTGMFRLLGQNIRRRRWTRTTSIVATFAFINIAGRLSVATFGLTFNLTDKAEVNYPLMVSNWSVDPNDSSPKWIAVPDANYTGLRAIKTYNECNNTPLKSCY